MTFSSTHVSTHAVNAGRSKPTPFSAAGKRGNLGLFMLRAGSAAIGETAGANCATCLPRMQRLPNRLPALDGLRALRSGMLRAWATARAECVRLPPFMESKNSVRAWGSCGRSFGGAAPAPGRTPALRGVPTSAALAPYPKPPYLTAGVADKRVTRSVPKDGVSVCPVHDSHGLGLVADRFRRTMAGDCAGLCCAGAFKALLSVGQCWCWSGALLGVLKGLRGAKATQDSLRCFYPPKGYIALCIIFASIKGYSLMRAVFGGLLAPAGENLRHRSRPLGPCLQRHAHQLGEWQRVTLDCSAYGRPCSALGAWVKGSL